MLSEVALFLGALAGMTMMCALAMSVLDQEFDDLEGIHQSAFIFSSRC